MRTAFQAGELRIQTERWLQEKYNPSDIMYVTCVTRFVAAILGC
jgi:hypothetical protein